MAEMGGPLGFRTFLFPPPGSNITVIETYTQNISVVGTRADGTTTLTLFYNNYGPVETFALSAGFTDLVRVDVTSSFLTIDGNTYSTTPSGQVVGSGGYTRSFGPSSISVDNLQVTASTVTAVPEPSTVALFGVSFVALALARYRRRDRDSGPPRA